MLTDASYTGASNCLAVGEDVKHSHGQVYLAQRCNGAVW